MFDRIRRWKLGAAGALIVAMQVMLVPGRAWGQQKVQFRENGPGVWPWLIALGLFVMLAGVGFMNAKRTHLD